MKRLLRALPIYPCLQDPSSGQLHVDGGFLVTFPVFFRESPIRYVASFTWGFALHDPPTTPELLPVRQTGGDSWNGHLSLLRGRFARWTFKDSLES